MKKVLVLVSLLVVAAACTTSPTGNNNMTSNANKPPETKTTTAVVSESDIIAKEKAAWDTIKKKDWDGFAKTLASDYLEVLDDGAHDRAATLTSIKDLELTDVTFADWKMLTIDKDAVIITYSATVKGIYKGEAIPPGPYREASVYVNRNGEWATAFYQETLARTMPPPPPPMATPKPPASPMAKPAETTSDVTANEKLVWDALKSRNFEAFGSYLASDAMEMEADGVYDKAGSVKGVSMFDFSKVQLSDWKTLKLDDDASVVTYTVTNPGMKPEKEFHSTVWVSRDGKWRALFHQGTPAKEATPAKPEKKG
ncbi:MAG: DUF4440 domain-containing protein [Pyrinomonadaceae bacterium]